MRRCDSLEIVGGGRGEEGRVKGERRKRGKGRWVWRGKRERSKATDTYPPQALFALQHTPYLAAPPLPSNTVGCRLQRVLTHSLVARL